MGYPLAELARHVGGTVHGDPARVLSGVATLEDAAEHELSFLTHPRYRAAAARTRAGALLVGPGVGMPGRDLLEVERPVLALAAILELYHPQQRPAPGVSPDARLAADVQLGSDVSVGPFAVIGAGAVLSERVVVGAGAVLGAGTRVGADSELGPRVVLYPATVVGARCRIHAGVVLGGDGFGFTPDATGHHVKLPQVGAVVVEDDVEIGANSTVDRAMLGRTRLGRGTKLDNLVQVAHGVELGEHSLLAAQSGIAGSSRLGARATLAGQAGVAGHLTLGAGVRVAAASAVLADQPDGAFVAGIPARDHRAWKRAQVELHRLGELRGQLRALERRLAALEATRGGER